MQNLFSSLISFITSVSTLSILSPQYSATLNISMSEILLSEYVISTNLPFFFEALKFADDLSLLPSRAYLVYPAPSVLTRSYSAHIFRS